MCCPKSSLCYRLITLNYILAQNTNARPRIVQRGMSLNEGSDSNAGRA
jgi:hypothetical protein